MYKHIKYEWISGIEYTERIYNFLLSIDEIMIPPLSERVILFDYAKKISERAQTLFIITKKKDIASCSIYCNTNVSFITSIAVKQEYQHQNLGKSLLEEVKKFVVKKNCKAIRLDVYDKNKKAIQFYKKNYFYEIKENKNWITMEYSMEEKQNGRECY